MLKDINKQKLKKLRKLTTLLMSLNLKLKRKKLGLVDLRKVNLAKLL